MDSTKLPEGTEKELLDAIDGNLEAIKVNEDIFFVPTAVHNLIEELVQENLELRKTHFDKTIIKA